MSNPTPVTTRENQKETASPSKPMPTPGIVQSNKASCNTSPVSSLLYATSPPTVAKKAKPTAPMPKRANKERSHRAWMPATMRAAPSRGKPGIRTSNPLYSTVDSLFLAPQRAHFVHVRRVPAPEYDDDKPQTDGRFRRPDDDDHEGEHVAVHKTVHPGEGQKQQRRGSPHQFDSHEHDEGTAAHQDR